MKKYESYTDSGVEWIVEIPSHWSHSNLKWYSDIYSGGTPSKEIEEYWSNGTIPWLNSGSVNQGDIVEASEYITEEAYNNSSAKWIAEGSLIIALAGQGKTKGMVAQVKFKTTCNQSLGVIVPNDKINNRFLLYWIRSNYQNIRNLGGGDKRDGLNLVMLGAIPMPIPTLSEQAKIAKFLDQKIAQIDQLIAKKETFIKLLEEENKVYTKQAVTKGLNPTVPMKDSGDEWLGEIPSHWNSYRIDWITNIVRGNTGFLKDELLDTGEYVALQYGKTYKVDIIDESFNYYVNDEFFKESQIVSKGDTILISTSETIEDLGHTCYYNSSNIGLLGGEQILLKPNRNVLYEKFLYQYASQLGAVLKKYAKGLKVFRFNTNDLKRIYISIPSIEEQIQISNRIEIATTRKNKLINKMEKEIEFYKEYKTTLIREVVTGKVDVRSKM